MLTAGASFFLQGIQRLRQIVARNGLQDKFTRKDRPAMR